MDKNNAEMVEFEDVTAVDEAEEVSENSGTGAFVVGIAGGFLAYAAIGVVKKTAAFVGAKLKERKLKKEAAKATVIDVDVVEETDEQTDFDEEPNK